MSGVEGQAVEGRGGGGGYLIEKSNYKYILPFVLGRAESRPNGRSTGGRGGWGEEGKLSTLLLTSAPYKALYLQQPRHEHVRVASITVAASSMSPRRRHAPPAATSLNSKTAAVRRVVPHAALPFARYREVVVYHDLVHLKYGRRSRHLSHLRVYVCVCMCVFSLFNFKAQSSSSNGHPAIKNIYFRALCLRLVTKHGPVIGQLLSVNQSINHNICIY